MLDPALRPIKDRMLAPLARVIAPSVHPTTITIAGFIVGIACAVSLYGGAYAIGLALWGGNRLLDGLDGLVARMSSRQTDLGGYIDIVLDLAVYAAVPIALVYGRGEPGPQLGLALAALLASFYVNAGSWMYLSGLIEKRRPAGASRPASATSLDMPVGLVEGTETIVFFTAFIILPDELPALFGAMALLVGATVVQRVLWVVRRLPRS